MSHTLTEAGEDGESGELVLLMPLRNLSASDNNPPHLNYSMYTNSWLASCVMIKKVVFVLIQKSGSLNALFCLLLLNTEILRSPVGMV